MIIPNLLDAYVAMLQAWPSLEGVIILDGPAVQWTGNEGIAVGASFEDNSGAFRPTAGDITRNDGTSFMLTCVAYAGAGVTTFKPSRDRASYLYDGALGALSADRTMRGSVSTAWLSSGIFRQVQTGSGVLVAIEFQVEASHF